MVPRRPQLPTGRRPHNSNNSKANFGGRSTINPAANSSLPPPSPSPPPATMDNVFQHNIILQQSILEVLDRETERFAEELQEKDDQVNEIRATKQEMALFLSHQMTENKRLNEQLSKARTNLEQLTNESKTIKMNNKKLSTERLKSIKTLKVNQIEMTRMKEDMEQQKELVKGMQLATAAFHSDIKVRTLVQQRLENDNEMLTITIDDLNNTNNLMNKKLEKNAINTHELNKEQSSAMKLNEHFKALLTQSEHQVQELQLQNTSLRKENLVKEKHHLSMKVLVKEITESQHMKNMQVLDLQQIHSIINNEYMDSQKKIKHLETKNQTQVETIQTLEEKLNKEIKKNQEHNKVLQSHGIAADGHSVVTEKLEHKIAKLNVVKRIQQNTILELRTLNTTTNKVHQALQVEAEHDTRTHDSTIQHLANEHQVQLAQKQTKIILLSNEIAKHIKEKNMLNTMLLEMTSQHHALATSHLELQTLYSTSDTKALEAQYQAQRDRTLTNKLKYELNNTITNKYSEIETQHNVQIKKLKKQIVDKDAKLKLITRNWKTVQNECVTWKHKYQHLNHQKQQLQSSEQISLQGKRRVESSLQQMSKSLVQEQIKSDTTKVRLQQSKIQLSTQHMKNNRLNYKIKDANLLLKGREEEYVSTVQILKGTIHALQQELKSKKNINLTILREEENIKNHAICLKSKLKLITEELKMTKTELFEIKTKYARITGNTSVGGKAQKAKQTVQATKNLEAMLFKRRMERLQKSSKKGRNQNQTGHGTNKKNGQQQRQPSASNSSSSSSTTALGGMRKDTLQLNKALSIGAERLHEIIVLKNALEDVTQEKNKYKSLYTAYYNNIQQQDKQKQAQLAMANRALRAESMAGWMEQQLLAMDNRVKIDYSYHPEIVISDALNEVLQEQNWLVHGDEIAANLNEQDLAALAQMNYT